MDRPTAKASMLVATESTTKVIPFVESFSLLFPCSLFENASLIMFDPTRASKEKATQWAYISM